MKKEELRKRFLAKRNKLSKSEIIKRGNLAKEKLFSIKEYKKADKVMFFVSFNKEIHTHSAIKKALKEKIVSVPKIIESNIIPCIIKSFSELSEGKYKILEPIKTRKTNLKKNDIVVVPGIVFDKFGYRIGYGKGYYDRFLKKTKALAIGLCMDFQVIDRIPKTRNDIPVNIIITEKRIIKIKQAQDSQQ